MISRNGQANFFALWIGVIAGLAPGVVVWAQESDLTEFVQRMFQEQYQRPPTGVELNYYANLSRTNGPLENYIEIYGSDEFFANQSRGSYQVFVTRLFQTFLGRSPRPDELNYWVVQFQRSGGNRRDMVRQFCNANRITQLPGGWLQQPGISVPRDIAEIARQLVYQSGLFVNLIRNELGYSVYGARLVAEGQTLAANALQFQQVSQNLAATNLQWQQSLGNLDRSLASVESEFYRIPGASPQSQQVLQQVSHLILTARNAVATANPENPVLPPAFRPLPGYREVVAFRDGLRQFTFGLQGYQYQGPPYESLYRDAQSFLVQVETLELMMRQNRPMIDVRNAAQNISLQFNRLSPIVQRADFTIQQNWWNLRGPVATG